MTRHIKLIVAILISTSVVTSQDRNPFIEDNKRTKRARVSHERVGLLKSSALVWIKIYQKVIASQDVPTCQFSPSCSNFGFQAVNKYGLIQGTLLTADRLLRCNPFIRGHYPTENDRYFDPVQNYIRSD